jgi:hypothetical protein
MDFPIYWQYFPQQGTARDRKGPQENKILPPQENKILPPQENKIFPGFDFNYVILIMTNPDFPLRWVILIMTSSTLVILIMGRETSVFSP